MKQPTHISGTNEECIAKIELMKLHVLQDIDLSLAYMVDIFNAVKDQEKKSKPKEPVEKTCDPNCKADSEWEEIEC